MSETVAVHDASASDHRSVATCDSVVDDQDDNGAYHSDNEAVDIQPGNRSRSDQREQEAADDRANNAKVRYRA